MAHYECSICGDTRCQDPKCKAENEARFQVAVQAKLHPPAIDASEQSKAPASPGTATANDRQVGGSHYAGSYQHWDFVADMGLDYWQACASKYVTRWRKKNGLEDLAKAPHYMEKRAELMKAERIVPPDKGKSGMGSYVVMTKILDFCGKNDLDARDAEAIFYIVMGDTPMALEAIAVITEKTSSDRPSPYRPIGC